MLNTDFYKKLDSELATIIEEDISNPIFTHKDKEKNKPLALLMWFLKFYGQTHAYAKYIVDGDGDNSCDIILDINDVNKGKVYYIVQVKWNSEKNSNGKIDSQQFKATLEDFKLILADEKASTKNENFNRQNKKLQKHIEQNGLVKFIYLTLCNDNLSIADSIASFGENYQSSIEILDINRIKSDFIDARYKKIIHNNPLENYEEPIRPVTL
ncbi:MAG: hypothetical protein ACPG5B_15895 [Chitinophagales bacterium]